MLLDAEQGGNVSVGSAGCALQHDPAAQGQRLRRGPTPGPAVQHLTLVIGQRQLGLRPSRPRHPAIMPNRQA
ncbi:hypothetical protein, partial [Streptomyces sp. MK5]|uniref:hypothetical protein n=1 Tax=Streptomyces sp. MK5 TaxID=3064253 RepID=UPI002740E401